MCLLYNFIFLTTEARIFTENFSVLFCVSVAKVISFDVRFSNQDGYVVKQSLLNPIRHIVHIEKHIVSDSCKILSSF